MKLFNLKRTGIALIFVLLMSTLIDAFDDVFKRRYARQIYDGGSGVIIKDWCQCYKTFLLHNVKRLSV